MIIKEPSQSHEYYSSSQNPLKYFIKNWKIIVIFGLLGIISAVLFNQLLPKSYEAIGMIELSQVNFKNRDINNVQNTDEILAKIKLYTFFSDETHKSCKQNAPRAIKKVFTPKNTNLIEITISHNSPENAIKCTQMIFEDVKKNQNLIIKEITKKIKNNIIQHEKKIQLVKKLSQDTKLQADNSNIVFLLDIYWLSSKILNDYLLVNSLEENQIRLVSPIHSPTIMVNENIIRIIFIGLILGVLLGLLLNKIWCLFQIKN